MQWIITSETIDLKYFKHIISYMRYIALLRGINAGGNRKVEMKKLRDLFEFLKYFNVSTYLNTGNVIFESDKKHEIIRKEIKTNLKKEFGFEILSLIKTETEVKKIAGVIPKHWQNDSSQRTDVAFLFPEIDSKKTLEELPVRKEFIDIRYIKGAIYWNIDRKNYNKSHLNKIISHRSYQFMTLRNINTVRFLAGNKK